MRGRLAFFSCRRILHQLHGGERGLRRSMVGMKERDLSIGLRSVGGCKDGCCIVMVRPHRDDPEIRTGKMGALLLLGLIGRRYL